MADEEWALVVPFMPARKLAVIMHRMLVTCEAFAWPEADTKETPTA
jgi:hypothetical protein